MTRKRKQTKRGSSKPTRQPDLVSKVERESDALVAIPDERTLHEVCAAAAADFGVELADGIEAKVSAQLEAEYHFAYGDGVEEGGLQWQALLAHRACLVALADHHIADPEKRLELHECLGPAGVESLKQEVIQALSSSLNPRGLWFLPDAWWSKLTKTPRDRGDRVRECERLVKLDVVAHCLHEQNEGLSKNGVQPDVFAKALTLALYRREPEGDPGHKILRPRRAAERDRDRGRAAAGDQADDRARDRQRPGRARDSAKSPDPERECSGRSGLFSLE